MRAAALVRLALLAAPLLMPVGVGASQTSPPAQDSDTTKARGWLVGGSIGVPAFAGVASSELFTIAVHGTQLRPGGLGADFAVGTMPRALVAGVAVGFARALASLGTASEMPKHRCRSGNWGWFTFGVNADTKFEGNPIGDSWLISNQ